MQRNCVGPENWGHLTQAHNLRGSTLLPSLCSSSTPDDMTLQLPSLWITGQSMTISSTALVADCVTVMETPLARSIRVRIHKERDAASQSLKGAQLMAVARSYW